MNGLRNYEKSTDSSRRWYQPGSLRSGAASYERVELADNTFVGLNRLGVLEKSGRSCTGEDVGQNTPG